MYNHGMRRLLVLRRPCSLRHASTSSSYPFPTHAHPTPHQIFHLSPGASQQDIKARYFDLVKIYHPDSPACRHVPQSVRHSRFQSVTHAYDVLRGKTPYLLSRGDSWNDPVYAELDRRRRRGAAPHVHPRTQGSRGWGGRDFGFSDWGEEVKTVDAAKWNEHWKDKLIMCAAIVALGGAIFQGIMYNSPQQIENRHRSAASNLAQARAEAREFGMERRAEIRKRVQEQKELELRRLQQESLEEAARVEHSQQEAGIMKR